MRQPYRKREAICVSPCPRPCSPRKTVSVTVEAGTSPAPAGAIVSSAERHNGPRDRISCQVALPSLDVTENRRRQGRARQGRSIALSPSLCPRIYKETPTRPLRRLPRPTKQTSKLASDPSFPHSFATHEAPPLRAGLCPPRPPIRRT